MIESEKQEQNIDVRFTSKLIESQFKVPMFNLIAVQCSAVKLPTHTHHTTFHTTHSLLRCSRSQKATKQNGYFRFLPHLFKSQLEGAMSSSKSVLRCAITSPSDTHHTAFHSLSRYSRFQKIHQTQYYVCLPRVQTLRLSNRNSESRCPAQKLFFAIL
jgi:hypothetical protein